jgi:hypothetical protein
MWAGEECTLVQISHRSQSIGDGWVDPHVGFDDATIAYREMFT